MRKSLQVVVLLLVVGVVALAQNQREERPSISVYGEAEILVKPDQMTFAFGINSLDKNVMTARSANEDRSKRVFEAINKFNIPSENIQTSYLSIREEYNEGEYNKNRQFLGYRVSRSIIVMTKDMAHAEDLVAAVVNAGVNDIGGINLQRSDYPRFREEARAKAMAAARQKADLMSRALGQSVGKAFSIQELNEPSVQPVYRNLNSNSISIDAGNVDAVESSSTIAAGQIKIVARVEIKFELN